MVRWFVVSALCLLCSVAVGVQAQTAMPSMRVGAVVSAGQNMYSANFHNLEGVPVSDSANNFTNGDGFGYGIAGVWELPVRDNIVFGTRLGLHYLGGVLRTQEGPIPSEFGDVVLEHAIDASVFSVAAEAGVGVRFGKHWLLSGGTRLGWVASSVFEQTESIVQPVGREYLQGGSTRSIAARQRIPNAPSFELAFVGRLGYELPLTSTVVLRPEVAFHVGTTDISAATGWRVSTLHGGIALLWQPARTKPIRTDTVYNRDTTVQVVAGLLQEEVVENGSTSNIEQRETPDEIQRTVVINQHYIQKVPRPRPLLVADLGVRFVLDDGSETEGVQVTIKKVVEQQYIPLLPYVFFDSASAVLPQRYSRITATETAGFSLRDTMPRNVLATYCNVLNIVGMRMRQYPKATLFITGTRSGDKVESTDTLLARRRAESVQTYLTTVWNIELRRLQIRYGGLPERPSNETLAGGSEENRRAELHSDEPAIVAPLHVSDTVRVANPPIVRFYPQGLSEAGIATWQLHIAQGNRVLKSFRGEGTLPPSIDWNINHDKAILISADAPMEYQLLVRDNEQQEAETPQGSIVFQVREHNAYETEKGTVQRYSLIVFDYGGVSLTQQHRAILSIVQNNLPEHVDIAVVGMTDVLGESEYNKQLSLRRAQAVVAALKRPEATATGLGEQTDIPATTPEGRFYSRRVDIIVRTHSTQ